MFSCVCECKFTKFYIYIYICIYECYNVTYCIELTRAADKAIDLLQDMRCGYSGQSGVAGFSGRRKRIKTELCKSFPSKKPPKKCSWKHRFVCLAKKDQQRIPTTDIDKDELLEAGLGEKNIEFETLEMDGNEFRSVLY